MQFKCNLQISNKGNINLPSDPAICHEYLSYQKYSYRPNCVFSHLTSEVYVPISQDDDIISSQYVPLIRNILKKDMLLSHYV